MKLDFSRYINSLTNIADEGYPPIFYIMLILSLIGVVGFFMVAMGAAGVIFEVTP